MSKQVNANIGHVECFICDRVSAVRKNKAGALYYDCLSCGRIAPNHKPGQGALLERAKIWGPDGPPPEIPKWIREQWPYGLAVREGMKEAPPVNKEPPPGLPEEPPPPPPRRSPKAPPEKTTESPEESARSGGILGLLFS